MSTVKINKPKILIVDDKPENLVALEKNLSDIDAELIKATSGNDALKETLNHQFALAIVDVKMPGMDGYEFVELMRSENDSKNIPVILMTAFYLDDAYLFKAYKTGAVDFLTKPYNYEVLQEKVKVFVEIEKQRKQLEEYVKQQRITNEQLKQEMAKRRQIEIELKKAKEKAEETNRLKSIFLANMSHEIRTPMNAIIGYTDILISEETDSEKKEQLNIIQQSGKNLVNLINDILDFSVIEADKLEIKRSEFSMRDLLKHLEQMFMLIASVKSILFYVKIYDSLPEKVFGDEYRLNQVIVNLLSNAFKFTKHGSVTLTCSYVNGTAVVNVIDTGIGVAMEKQDLIFTVFQQGDSSTTRTYGGTGLGLSITKKLLEMMDGTISLKSDIGAGSTFTVKIHLPEIKIDGKERENNQKIKNSNAIVKKGLGLINNFIDTDNYVFLNYKNLLEKTDRLEDAILIKNKKDIEFITNEILNISISLNLSEINKIAVELFGEIKKDSFNIEKVRNLFHKIKGLISSLSAEYSNKSIKNNIENLAKNLNVLVAEDNPVNQLIVKTMLHKMNIKANVAENGKIAFDMLKEGKYDLLFLDMQMPVMDGWETIKQIRSDDNLKKTIVIALTADAMKGDAEKCINAGCDGYLSKPITRQKLFEKINSLIANKKHSSLTRINRKSQIASTK